eukprot:1068420-Amphidinium_carterae.1
MKDVEVQNDHGEFANGILLPWKAVVGNVLTLLHTTLEPLIGAWLAEGLAEMPCEGSQNCRLSIGTRTVDGLVICSSLP